MSDPAPPDPRLDPEIARFIALLSAAWRRHPPLDAMTIDQARIVAEEVRAPWAAGGPVMVETRDLTVTLPDGDLKLRIHRPPGLPEGPVPALLYLHGGGFVFFSIDSHDRLMREYAAAAGIVVVGIDYPLAPEARYPVALRRVVGFARWLEREGISLGIDARRLALGGDSAGANLALATAMILRDAGEADRVRSLLLNYGAFSGQVSEGAEAAYGGPEALLTAAEMEFYFERYLRDPTDAADPYACPLVAEDMSRLPPALFVIPELDVLREQSETVADRMTAAGCEVVATIYAGATHSFLEAVSIAPVAKRAICDGANWLAETIA